MENQVNWGVIGAGDVVMRKSGAPLQDLPGSRWQGLYRRDATEALRVAARFGVPRIYESAADLLADPGINAVYVSTPPSTHTYYAIAALEAGKNVYLEKPMALNTAEAGLIRDAADRTGGKLVMAHYRRALPAFREAGRLLAEGAIGTPLFARIRIIQPRVPDATSTITSGLEERSDGLPWRLDPLVSGGGLFHDLAPHQLDLALLWFGPVRSIRGLSRRLSPSTDRLPAADDYVSGTIEFESGLILDGLWSFCADSAGRSADEFAIYGSEGRLSFSFFGERLLIEGGDIAEEQEFPLPDWLQQPMLDETVKYFLGQGQNPCPGTYGVQTMEIIDALTTG